jgi:alpha-glucosidase
MKRHLAAIFCVLASLTASQAQEIWKLKQIAGVASVTKTANGVLLNCKDDSQVQLLVLAPDLVRVRASFAKPLATHDHSWAIANSEWPAPPWTLSEQADAIVLTTDELEVVVHRAPLLIDFRDAKTHAAINEDEQPMVYDAEGLLKDIMFDPGAGRFVAVSKRLGFDEHFYGLGEKAARLDKRRNSFVNWNSDTPGYLEGRDPIYLTIPFYTGLQNGKAYGIFFDNSYRSYFDFGKSSQKRVWFGAEGGEVNYYFFYGPSLKKILSRYAELTGHMPMPPLWALGNQQSRWSYYPESMVRRVVSEYRQRDLPLDVLHLDIDYMQDYRVFTWNRERFPDPKAMSDQLLHQGVKLVAIIDPGVKYQPVPKNAAVVTSITPDFKSGRTATYSFRRSGRAKAFSSISRCRQRANGGAICFVPTPITEWLEFGMI